MVTLGKDTVRYSHCWTLQIHTHALTFMGFVEFLNSSYIMKNFIKHEEFTHTVSLCIFKYLQFVIPNKYVIGGAGFLDFNIV